MVAGVRHVPYDRLEAMVTAIDESVAAVLLEVVQGEGGVRPASPGYIAAVANLCRARGALLILDEVQTGFGRTGRLFACEHDGVAPDMLCMAKSMAGGLPMGAVALGERVTGIRPGAHGSTFGGNPLACAAAIATLEVLRRDRLVERSATIGARMLEQLTQVRAPVVRDVRGLGLMIGIELRDKVRPFLNELQARGVLALPAGTTTIRLLPPLVIDDAQVDAVVTAVGEALRTWQPHRAETAGG
jgi:acetylornithine/LysW-gamma-L-lysine aminotransferase